VEQQSEEPHGKGKGGIVGNAADLKTWGLCDSRRRRKKVSMASGSSDYAAAKKRKHAGRADYEGACANTPDREEAVRVKGPESRRILRKETERGNVFKNVLRVPKSPVKSKRSCTE